MHKEIQSPLQMIVVYEELLTAVYISENSLTTTFNPSKSPNTAIKSKHHRNSMALVTNLPLELLLIYY